MDKAAPEVTVVAHLAAQAGVRYSLENPFAYIEANVMGHLSVMEACRNFPGLGHLVYASSSSVYGANHKVPFAVADRVDQPVSLYAASLSSFEDSGEAEGYRQEDAGGFIRIQGVRLRR